MTEEETLETLRICRYSHPVESYCRDRLRCPYYDRFETCLARLHRDALKCIKRLRRTGRKADEA